MMAKKKMVGQEPSEESLVWAGSAPAMDVKPVVALPPEPINLGVYSRDVDAWLADARACQAVYSSGNAVSVGELQRLVNRAVGLLV